MNTRARSIRGRSPPHLSEILTDRHLVKICFTTRSVRKPTPAQTGTRPALLLVFPTSVPQTLLKGRIDCSSGLASIRPFLFLERPVQCPSLSPEPMQRQHIHCHKTVAPCLTRGWASLRRVSVPSVRSPIGPEDRTIRPPRRTIDFKKSQAPCPSTGRRRGFRSSASGGFGDALFGHQFAKFSGFKHFHHDV